ncbi:MAG TPA: M20/M25/M40 family metallo-hydrolase [Candidatus Saccharimonadales bacterium]|nr:M20/M25/M40 family metallo-hydrolase [Candidatus Saccharimonadales bacterium]
MDQYLQKLISFKSNSSDQAACQEALKYVADFCAAHGLHVKEYDFNGVASFVATVKPNDLEPKVMLVAHIDVVPARQQDYTLTEKDGNYYGRGVYDMKSAIANYMNVVDVLGDDLKNYSLGIMIVTDEEAGGQNGVKQLVAEGYRPGICILPDGGQNWDIEALAKGFIQADINVVGKAAHGARPWEGDSAIIKLVHVLNEVSHLFDENAIHTSSLNIGTISGGDAINQIPAHASAALDIRYVKHEDYTHLTEAIHDICTRHGATYTKRFVGRPCVTDLKHPQVIPFVESITKITGHEVTGTMSYGGSDGRFFAAVDVPCVLTHPEGGEQHATGEWISKKGFEQFNEVILDYLHKAAKN